MTTTRITTALVLAVGLLASGCGDDGGGDDGDVASLDGEGAPEAADSGEDPDAAMMEWVECMRDEGVPLDDPVRDEDGNIQISGPGMQIGTGGPGDEGGPGGGEDEEPPGDPADGEDDESPDPETMDAASEACGDLPPNAMGERGEVDEEAMQEQMLEFAECMRTEGVDDFPDPDFSGSGPGGVTDERESDSGMSDEGEPEQRVMIGPFGEIDMEDPETEAAFDSCEDVLARPDGEDGPGGDT